MYDRYDAAKVFNQVNCSLSFCSTQSEESILLSFTAWCELKNIPDNEFNDMKKVFFEETLPGEGDVLTKILSDDNYQNKRGQIEFLYSTIDFISEFKGINIVTEPERCKKDKLIAMLKKPGVLSNLIGVTVDSDADLKLHISQVDKTGIEMFWFKDAGIFISIGSEVNPEQYKSINISDYLAIFKALGDESRLKIIKALIKENLTSSQLAEKVGLTMPTINHHLKQLSGCRLVGMLVSGKSGKGTQYRFNRDTALTFLEKIKDEIS